MHRVSDADARQRDQIGGTRAGMTNPVTLVPRIRPRALVPRGAGRTHTGLVRQVNEDAILTDPGGILWAVADGMGGHGQGDIAADVVIDSLLRLPHSGDPQHMLALALEDANAIVFDRSQGAGNGIMGATIVAAMVEGGLAVLAWVGDSRGCLVRDGKLTRLTKDHSLVQEMVDAGDLPPELAETHPQANVVTRAIGAARQVEIDFNETALRAGDVLLLCSDGLSKCVPDANIAALLGNVGSPEAACIELVRAALRAGGPDNVSVIVIFMEEA